MLPLRVREDLLCSISANPSCGAAMNQTLAYTRRRAFLPEVSLHAKLPCDGQERTLFSRSRSAAFPVLALPAQICRPVSYFK
jgi:hypothetical protein